MAEENKREFTDEQLRAHEGHIGLQAGYNKGASQAGVGAFGNTRHMWRHLATLHTLETTANQPNQTKQTNWPHIQKWSHAVTIFLSWCWLLQLTINSIFPFNNKWAKSFLGRRDVLRMFVCVTRRALTFSLFSCHSAASIHIIYNRAISCDTVSLIYLSGYLAAFDQTVPLSQ